MGKKAKLTALCAMCFVTVLLAVLVGCAGDAGSSGTSAQSSQSSESSSSESAAKEVESSPDLIAELEELEKKADSVGSLDSPVIGKSAVESILTTASYKADVQDSVATIEDTFLRLSDRGLAEAYTVKVEGDAYTLPCTLQDFFDKGWTTDTSEWGNSGIYYAKPDELPAEDEYAPVSLFKGGKRFDVYYTPANGADRLEACAVFKIEIASTTSKDFSSIELGSGVSIGSSVYDVLAAYGQPYSTSVSDRAGQAHYGPDEADWFISRIEYSRTDSLSRLVKDMKEMQKKVERMAAEAAGEISFGNLEALTASSRPLGAENVDYDNIVFEFNRETGDVRAITVINSWF